MRKKTVEIFLEMLRSGLWEKEARLSQFGEVDFEEIRDLAKQQSVVGLVTAAFDHIEDYKVPKRDVLNFFQHVYVLEKRNQDMNSFIEDLWHRLAENGIEAVLVKGQGIATCYERPLWRESGDVDILLMPENFDKANEVFRPLASSFSKELGLHSQLNIGKWSVEIHGSQGCGLSSPMDAFLADLRNKTFENGGIRIWHDGKTDIPLPEENNDVIFVFTHFLKHFYKGGLGLRQICDWSRLMWTYRDSLDSGLLISRLQQLGLVSEWKAFCSFAVEYLGMPKEAIILYDDSAKWKRKAARILSFLMRSGNFGHNRGNEYQHYPYLMKKTVSMSRRVADFSRHMRIFPTDSLKFLTGILKNGVKAVSKGI